MTTSSSRSFEELRRALQLTRRQLLSAAGAAVLLGCSRRLATQTRHANPPNAETKRITLSASEWLAVAAITERILPSDSGAGAREANVVRFVDAALASRLLTPVASVVRRGVAVIDDYAKQANGRVLCELDPAVQDELLTHLSRGSLPIHGLPQRELFAVLHVLTIEGFLSNPSHGGNANEVGWRAIGFATPHRQTADEPAHPHRH